MKRALVVMAGTLLLISACDRADTTQRGQQAETAQVPVPPAQLPAPVAIHSDPRDSVIVEEKLAWARAQKLDTLPTGELMARLGRTFVGTPYTPGTLEVPGEERLVINLRELDCVTFVENMLAMARVLRAGQGGYDAFKRELMRIRYRDGELNGYTSRLHYFSEWIANNQAKGIVRNITRELGGLPDTEPLNFMTSHASAYRQLADSTTRNQILAIEQRLNQVPRYVIPEDSIARVAAKIQNGDIIGAASSLPGLDIAHTGLALWVDGKLHLMHAPLVGKAVEISQLPLAERIKSIDKQDGIMVARPVND